LWGKDKAEPVTAFILPDEPAPKAILMKMLLLCLLAVGVARSPRATPATVPRQDDPLAPHRWKARVLLVFAPRTDAPASELCASA